MPKSIMVVDDAGQSLTELTQALRDAGYEPVVTPPSDDPVLRFGVVRPELVFVSLDDHDPSTVCDGIRSDPDGAIVPIVLVGKDHPQVRSPSDALSKGADYYFTRPVDLTKMLAKVQTYIGPGERGPAPKPAAAKAPAKVDVPKPGMAPVAIRPPSFDLEATPIAGMIDDVTSPGSSAAPPLPSGFPAPPAFGSPGAPRDVGTASDALLAMIESEEREADALKAAEAEIARERAALEAKQREAEEQSRRLAEERAQQEAEERARQQEAERAAQERARQEAEERAHQEAERQAAEAAHQAEALRHQAELERQAAEEALRAQQEAADLAQRDEQARREIAELARQEAEEAAAAEARQLEERVRRETEERLRRELETQARREAEERARREAADTARREAEERARRDSEERARKDHEERTKREAEERTKREAEERAKREAEERTRKEAEERAKREAEERARRETDERSRKDNEETLRRRVEEEVRRRMDDEQRKKEGEQAAQEAQRRVDEEARKRAEETERARAAVDQDKREAELRLRVEEEVRKKLGMPSSAGKPRPSPTSVTPFAPAEGSFGPTRDIATLLFELWQGEVTGRVDFTSEQRQKSLFLERGLPVDAYSSQVFDRIEEYLLREAKITRAQYQDVRVKALKTPRRIGAYLVSEGFLKPHELFESLRGHLEEVVYGLFEWETGEYRYVAERVSDDDRVTLDLDLRALLVEGIRRKYLLPRMMARVGGPSSLLGPLADQRIDVEPLRLAPEELKVVRLLDGTRNVEDLVFSTGLEAPRVYHVLTALVAMGSAQILVRGLEQVQQDGQNTADQIDKQRITDKLDQVRLVDYFQVLGVSRTATAYEIDRAFERTIHEFSPRHFSSSLQKELHDELIEIEQVLADAREVLRNQALRDAYARHLPS